MVTSAGMTPKLSAIAPKITENTANAILPANELIDPIVARCESVNSFCNSVFVATLPTPNMSEVRDMNAGERTVGNNSAVRFTTLLQIISN